MKGVAVRHRMRLRRDRQHAERAARRRRVASFGSLRVLAASGATSHVMIDERGNVSTVDVDPVRFAAAIDRAEAVVLSDAPLPDDDCPLCRAIAEAAIGEPRRMGGGAG